MTAGPHDLDRVQRWMQWVITHPGGVAAGIESARARNEIDVSTDDVESVTPRSKSQTGIERLQIYAGAYYARLLECLREEFPALAHAAGEKAFAAFAFGYLQAYPSHSYTLAKLGESFPKYLAETRPDDSAETSWPDFLIDLARLERAYAEVFSGPGIEGRTRLDVDALADIPPEHWPDVRLTPAASLRLMSFRFPVHEYATAVRNKQPARPPEPKPTFLAITRRDYIVRRHELSEVQHALLSGIVEDATLGDAIARAFQSAGGSIEHLAATLRQWFQEWAAAQFFEGVTGLRST